ncbi:hypothetical protein BJY16_008720 [Actinoplanes octamycinicus]|uniref:Uncharacterized protein n=1 Tax=Actinoplanes octamycinicus TaxID=135948 RepID=A0A7W7MCL3_9ACTN|nr:hypothetical protein [Actinoplanes octamycinicus]MBB4745261.1 hypothetical protein [Actinoplanes octamycinicus]GIE62261.1 hypothetical protein Aoc01nite_76630 [Actinoplanes octamycinicus]
MFGRSQDDRPPLQRALDAAATLKPGTWESVEALAQLAVACQGSPDAARIYRTAAEAAAQLKAGTFESVRALVWLHRAAEGLRPADTPRG